MTRISRHQMFMQVAQVVAQRATCFRLNVGAVIVLNRRIVSIGYNGRPAGEDHCTGHTCPGAMRCLETTHAEANAIKYMPSTIHGPADVYVTDSPCPDCWALIKGGPHQIGRVFFSNPYRVSDHLNTHDPYAFNDPKVYRLLPAGYCIDWRTKELVDIET